jgi:hypothetical protein
MTGRRLPVLVLAVAGFVAIVALVAHGRPLAASGGHGGVGESFWSYILTTTVILFALCVLLLIATLFSVRMEWTAPKTSFTGNLIRSMLSLFIFGVVIAYLARHHHFPNTGLDAGSGFKNRGFGGDVSTGSSGTHFVWLEVVIVFVLLVGAVAIAAVLWRRNRESMPELDSAPNAEAVAPEAVADALDESLDDLRSDPDLRRAIVAAYARMEHALRRNGLPRRPAEAPLEYLERALHTLDTSGPAVRRLTDLFEWAKFSHHEPEPSMRDEAVEALEAVRDELRVPVEVHA